MNNDKITYYLGSKEIINKPIPPYSDTVCDFLNKLSKHLRMDSRAKKYSDIMAFAYWCRKGNIQKLKKEFGDKQIRIGRGIVFHIAPSNVPVNFAFTFVFGLLSGNGNIVRVSTKKYEQTKLICNAIKVVFEQEQFLDLKKGNSILSYEPEQEITDYFSSICAARIIWGGNNTIEQIRKSPVSARCIEITFADRYSFAVLSSEAVLALNAEKLKQLAEDFYKDTYSMDQNACSSPHLVLWLSRKLGAAEEAQRRFWNQVKLVAQKYDLEDIKVSDKYTLLCEQAVNYSEIVAVHQYDNLIYVVKLEELPEKLCALRGKFGVFYELESLDLNLLEKCINEEYQTCLFFGVNEYEISEFIIKNNLRGIDRITSIGNAMDISTIWDGYDIVGLLSRIIGCQN